MTDKEVIIDSVNVVGCEYHSSTPSSELCYMKGNKCEDNPNCYYKQLQRLQAENEELKKKNNALIDKLNLAADDKFAINYTERVI